MAKKTFYITTPIYYPSGKWHLGSAYTTVLADAVARFKRLDGFDVFFLTGTDEHGMKIEKRAAENSMQPKEFVDGIVNNLKDLWKVMGISYDKFIRTTDEEHVKAVQNIFTKLYEKGDIYKSRYEGWYCVPCESFWTETQAKDGKCPDCGRPVIKSQEESYFFRLSKYADRLLKLYEDDPEFLLPKSRVNEMVNNFIKPGLEDLAVSRTSFKWGIPVPFDEKHIIYVWIDALSNYITALGYGSKNDSLYKKFWPADFHLMAKEIVRFHAVIWPAILMALDVPLPKRVYGHGWLLMGGDKLSKSKTENVKKDVIDPFVLCEKYGADALRYVLLKEGPFAGDTPYSNEILLTTINNDLANDLGNLVSRSLSMINQYQKGIIGAPGEYTELDKGIISLAESLYGKVSAHMDKCDVPSAIAEIITVVRRTNKYIEDAAPWILNKTEEGRKRIGTVMYILAETIRICAVLLAPVIPATSESILMQLGAKGELKGFDSVKKFGGCKEGTVINKGSPLFPRLDIAKETAELEAIAAPDIAKKQETVKPVTETVNQGVITIDEFAKIQLRTAKVTACEKVENSEKLLKLTLQAGSETRTVVSGISRYYSPEQLIGKNIVFVANLAPAKLKGILSEGMILCAEDSEGRLALVQPDKDIESGSEVR